MNAPGPSSQSHSQSLERTIANLRAITEPIAEYLEDDSIVEIMLNPDGRLWVEPRRQPMRCVQQRFSPVQAEGMLRAIAGMMGLELRPDHPTLACKMPVWGVRVQGCIPPAYAAPVFSLRKPPKEVIPLSKYVEQGAMSARAADLLREAMLARNNILICGATGTGKTTLLNALLHELHASNARVLIIEDTAEILCRCENVLQALVHAPSYTWQQAVKDAMRLRPDWLVLGEMRDGAALDVVKAWLSGHSGISTIHGEDTESALDRLGHLVEEVAHQAPRHTIAKSIDLCVTMRRNPSLRSGYGLHTIDRVTGFDPATGWTKEAITVA